jgi:hypothetical protein
LTDGEGIVQTTNIALSSGGENRSGMNRAVASSNLAGGACFSSTVKIYLDDDKLYRPTPPGWVRCYWPDEVIDLIKTGEVTHLSLDHDLGDDSRGKGIDIIDWLKDAINKGFEDYPRNIKIHSANSIGKQYMLSAIESLNRMIENKGGPPC